MTCGHIAVDINGFAKPNTLGKDIFVLYVTKDKIIPFGVQGDNFNPTTDCTKTGTGHGCSALYLYQ